MTLAITANIILIAIVLGVVVGMLGWAIRTSMPQQEAKRSRVRAARPRSVRTSSGVSLARR